MNFRTTKKTPQQENIPDKRNIGIDMNNDGIPDYLQNKSIPSLVQTNKDLNQTEMDTQFEIEQFLRGLAGYEYDPVNKVYIKLNKPIMNDLGVSHFANSIRTLSMKHYTTTALKAEEIDRILLHFMKEEYRWVKRNYKNINATLTDLNVVLIQLEYFMFGIMSKSIDGGLQRNITARTKLTGNLNADKSFP